MCRIDPTGKIILGLTESLLIMIIYCIQKSNDLIIKNKPFTSIWGKDPGPRGE